MSQQTLSRIFSRINLALVVISLVFLMASILLDHFMQHPPPQVSWLNDRKTLIDLTRDLGFAFLIGLVIAITIERSARFEHNKMVEEQIRKIQADVLREVFQISTPKAVFDAIKSGVLDVPFQRKSFRVVVRMLEELKATDGTVYIVIQLRVEYRIRNNSTNAKRYSIGVEIERPPLKEFEDKIKIVSVAVDDIQLSPKQLEEGHKLANDTKAFIRFSHQTDLQPGQEKEILKIFRSIKQQNDHEILHVLHPTDSMRVTLDFDTSKFDVEAYALHSRELTEAAGDLPGWRISDVLLPYQGINISWRPKTS
jgi:hypothetical protein